MRVDNGLSVDLSGLDHFQELDGMPKVANFGDVGSWINITPGHQLKCAINILGLATARTGDVDFFVVNDPSVEADNIFPGFQSAK